MLVQSIENAHNFVIEKTTFKKDFVRAYSYLFMPRRFQADKSSKEDEQ